MTLIDICDKCRNHTHEGRIEYYTSDRQQRLRSWVKLLILQKSSTWSPNTLRGSELTIINVFEILQHIYTVLRSFNPCYEVVLHSSDQS